jgi:hypothetical protein
LVKLPPLIVDTRDDATRLADALASIEDGLSGVEDPAVRSEEEESPGLLMMLRRLVVADPPTWEVALALEVVFDLGRYAAGEKVSVTERQRLAGLVRAAQSKAKANAWQAPAKQIWWEARGQFSKGDKRRKTQPQVAKAIERKVEGVPSFDRAFELVKKWDREARQTASAPLVARSC